MTTLNQALAVVAIVVGVGVYLLDFRPARRRELRRLRELAESRGQFVGAGIAHEAVHGNGDYVVHAGTAVSGDDSPGGDAARAQTAPPAGLSREVPRSVDP